MENNAVSQVQPSKSIRDSKLDILKGFAIISMLMAHCGAPFGREIQLFHMAAFFMASGYFYSQKNSSNLWLVCRYFVKKVLALYVPYILINILLILLHNMLIQWNFMTYNPLFLEIGGGGAVWGLKWPYDQEFKKACLKAALLFQNEPQLSGATWFLRALFVVSVFHCAFMWIIKKLRYPMLQKSVIVIAVVGCCIITSGISNGQINIIGHHKSYFAGWLVYLLGILIRKHEKYLHYGVQDGLMSLVALYILKNYGAVGFAAGYIQNIPFFIICSLLGWILLRSSAEVLHGIVAQILAYTGSHSLWIVLLHFIAFKAVTAVVILATGKNILLLASFPQLESDIPFLWVAYVAAGVILPLAVGALYYVVKRVIVIRIRGVYENICNRCGWPVGPRCHE